MPVKLQEVTFRSHGKTLHGYLRIPSGEGPYPVIVLCHGLTNDHRDAPLLPETELTLAKNGFATFCFDFYGSGRSEGLFPEKTISLLRTNLVDVLDFIYKQDRVRGESIGLWGRSIGGTICSFLMNDPRVKATLLASPPFRLSKDFKILYSPPDNGYVHLPERVQRSGELKGEWKITSKFFDEMIELEYNIIEIGKKSSKICLLQGGQDPKVSPEYTKELFELLQEPKEFHYFSGANHEYIGYEQIAVSISLDWFSRWLVY